jgi:protein-arginine kinase activator protein McsA
MIIKKYVWQRRYNTFMCYLTTRFHKGYVRCEKCGNHFKKEDVLILNDKILLYVCNDCATKTINKGHRILQITSY